MNLTSQEISAAARRSELALAEQASQWESLAFGVAFWSPLFPGSPETNQLRDAWLGEPPDPQTYEKVEAYFASRASRCLRWAPAAQQPVAPLAELLTARGWVEERLSTWGLVRTDAVATAEPGALRILPARAMPKAFQATFDSPADGALAVERLNDSRQDMFVAVDAGRGIGRIGYLQVGDIARLTDLFVAPGARRRGTAKTLVARFVQQVRRLGPRATVAVVPPQFAEHESFLERCGFVRGEDLVQFVRAT